MARIILQLEQVKHQSSLTLCDPAAARLRRSADSAQAHLAFAAIASLALFLASFAMGGSSPLSALSAAAGSVFMSKTALFLLSNAIFLLLAANYRCCRFTAAASASCDAAASSEPGGVLQKQTQQQHQVQVQVEVERCAVQSRVPCSGSLPHCKQEGEVQSTMSANRPADEGHDDALVLTKLELVRLAEEEDSMGLEIVPIDEPTCETAQELDKLEIDELNRKFDEFIQSRKIKWKEEASFLL